MRLPACGSVAPTPRAFHHAGSLKYFSTGAHLELVGNNGASYKHYQQFVDYYGDYNYADKWVSAALAGTDMSFTSGKHGPNNFATLGDAARIEAVKRGTAYMHVWMYAIGEFEDAINDCEGCKIVVYPPPSPPAAPCSDSCTDVPTDGMVGTNVVCATAPVFPFDSACPTGLKTKGKCQQTCADRGFNYADPPCCPSQSPPPPPAPASSCNEHAASTVSVHAWDEGVAFYTGSLEGTAYGGSSAGKLLPLALTLPL